MNRTNPRPMILPLPSVASTREAATIPFPRRGRDQRRRSTRRRERRDPRGEDRGVELDEMRGRLLKFIVSNEWDRTHGHRAS